MENKRKRKNYAFGRGMTFGVKFFEEFHAH